MTQVTIHDRPGRLRRPVLLLAFAGWNDAAESASSAVRFLRDRSQVGDPGMAKIEPEEFYDFTQARPTVRLWGGATSAPSTGPPDEFWLSHEPLLGRDFVLFVGVEPHLRWRRYLARTFGEVMEKLGVDHGGHPRRAHRRGSAHTQPGRPIAGYSSDARAMAEKLLKSASRSTNYEGPTGIVGVR